MNDELTLAKQHSQCGPEDGWCSDPKCRIYRALLAEHDRAEKLAKEEVERMKSASRLYAEGYNEAMEQTGVDLNEMNCLRAAVSELATSVDDTLEALTGMQVEYGAAVLLRKLHLQLEKTQKALSSAEVVAASEGIRRRSHPAGNLAARAKS